MTRGWNRWSPRLRYATTVSCSWLIRATKSGRPSPLRSATGTWIAPWRGSIVEGTKTGRPASVVRFSSNTDRPGLQPSELGDDQVQVPVAIEVGGLDVGDAAEPAGQGSGCERTAGISLEPDDTPDAIVGRHRAPQIGDEEILDSVAVQVRDLGMRGVGDGVAQDLELRRRLVRLEQEDFPVHHVARHHVEFTLVREVHEPDVGDARRRQPLRWPIPGATELHRARVGLDRPSQHRERLGCAVPVIGDHAGEGRDVGRDLDPR